MPLTSSWRVLAMLCLSALLLATPDLSSLFRSPTSTLAPERVTVPAEPIATTKEKLRLVDHLNKAWQVPVVLAHRIVGAAYREAQSIGAAPTLLLALIAKESSFNPQAQSSYGAVGLMQVVPRFHTEKIQDGESLHDPETNIRVGAQVLNEYLVKTGGALDPALKKYSGSATQYSRRVRAFQKEFESARTQDL